MLDDIMIYDMFAVCSKAFHAALVGFHKSALGILWNGMGTCQASCKVGTSGTWR